MENMEIERKWLVKRVPDGLDSYPVIEMEQAYLNISPTVRIRKENEAYYLTYKGIGQDDVMHEEYNLPITEEAFRHMLPKHDGRIIRKKRYVIPIREGRLKAELDIFEEPFVPLQVVEVEFGTREEAEAYEGEEWFGREVTKDPRFKNARMAVDPEVDPGVMLEGM
ncbi:MAG: CYTH domain-containing protein [Lachnospiraceae bacterium]|nr:CYTH domain-containing protein [Lachnospiraceae bacterium]